MRRLGPIALCTLLACGGAENEPGPDASPAEAVAGTETGAAATDGETEPEPVRFEPLDLKRRLAA